MKQVTGLLVCLVLLLAKGICAPPHLRITIANPSGFSRDNEIVEIPYERLGRLVSLKEFRVVSPQTGREVPYQLVFAGRETPQLLLLQVSLPARGAVTVAVMPGKPAKTPARTYARFVPERKDDFAWENDRVAFRMYGHALEQYPQENAHGIDVWSKRTTSLVIDTWYKLNNYHHDNGQGLDYYKVGMTLGAGDIAPYIQDSLYYSRNYRTWKVLDNGPLRSTFQLGYDEWMADSIPVSVTKTISLDAGSQLNKMQVEYTIKRGGSLPVAAGIVKRPEPGAQLLDEQQGVMGYWEPPHGEDGIIGVGCVFPKAGGVTQMRADQQHVLALGTVHNAQPFVYYFGAAWNKAGRIQDAQQWFAYLSQFAQKLQQPLTVTIQ